MSVVYFLQQNCDNKYIKIGYSSCFYSRLQNISYGTPYKIKILGWNYYRSANIALLNEEILHEKYSKYRIKNDWYYPNREILDYINDYCNHDAGRRYDKYMEY